MTGNDNGGGYDGGRPTPGSGDQSLEPLEEPAADRVTIARRLRAVERALSGAEDVEFDAGAADAGGTEAVAERLETIETRLDVLDSAVREIGECLVARDRARRTDDGVESVRRAVDALPGTAGRADDAGRSDRSDDGPDTAVGVVPGGLQPPTVPDGEGPSVTGESTAEWLGRVAAGGVTPPPVE